MQQYYPSYPPTNYYQQPAPSHPPQTSYPPAQPPPTYQPPPPGYEAKLPPKKVLTSNLLAPPPPPPPEPEPSTPPSSSKPSWQAAKAQPVVYKNPRPIEPTPPPRKPVSTELANQWPIANKPANVIEPTPEIQRLEAEMKEIEADIKNRKPKFQWYYNGQEWVYTTQPPEVKPLLPEDNPEYNYSFASDEDPVRNAVLANMRGNFNKPDKPKAVPIRCEVCNISVTCQVTYNTHVQGKNHAKKMVQMNKKVEQQKKLAHIKAKAVEVELGMAVVAEEEQEEVEEYNPLQILPNGDTRCELCCCNMNSEPQAITHVNGSKHRRALDKHRRSNRGRGRGRGGFGGGFGRGMSRGGMNPRPIPLMQVDTSGVAFGGPSTMGGFEDDDQEAREEYNAAFEEALANNVDIQEAHRIAESARQIVMSRQDMASDDPDFVHPFSTNGDGEDDEDATPAWPPRGIVILPSKGGVGNFRCDLCHVLLTSEMDLERHLCAPQHLSRLQMNMTGYSGNMPPGMRGSRGGPRIHKNGRGRGSMKAQRGRKGLIAEGEVIPAKRSKTEKTAAKAEMGKIIEEMRNPKPKWVETEEVKAGKTTNNKWNSMDKMKPLLMTFVKGGTMTDETKLMKDQAASQ